ncbi:MAG: ABC transporter ATP-binding protein [Chloroflexi bacterium]|nr:ABC transporter ATP-binding protein [Chloroflexota bacterium]
MAALLQVKDLRTYFFTQDGVVKAVDGVSFDIRQGEALGVVGESGCGKSVTALSIMRLVPHPPGRTVSGEIFFDGKNLLTLSDEQMRRVRGKEVAMIFQDPMTSLNPVLTVGRQISESLELHLKMSGTQARKRTIELLGMVGIPSAEQRVADYPHQFSGGMRQRVMIAMALACNPRMLIADEPTTALDVTIQAQIIDLVKRLRKELGTAVMWITHDLGVVAGMCDKVVVMYAGHVAESAPVRELYERPSHPYTLGLLRSIPRLDEERKAKLVPIEGLPPDLINVPPGCPFAPRCPYVKEVCRQTMPSLRVVGPGHEIACWVDVPQSAAARSA